MDELAGGIVTRDDGADFQERRQRETAGWVEVPRLSALSQESHWCLSCSTRGERSVALETSEHSID